MELNATSLAALRVGFSKIYDDAFGDVPMLRDRIAETVPSMASENVYEWLGDLEGMREWLGERVVDNFETKDYRIKNRDFEKTVGVDRNHIEDDNIGSYSMRFRLLGKAAADHPENLVWNALKNGWTEKCYDGQNFFDTDHPVIAKDGETVNSVANTDGGAGEPWFLLATTGLIKPIIFQERKKAMFDYLDDRKDQNVFMNRKFLYGVDARYAVGYSFWQLAWGSRQELNAANFEKARTALGTMTADYGEPLSIDGNLLVVGPTQEGAARRLLTAEYAAGGETNIWKGAAEMLKVQRLATAA